MRVVNGHERPVGLKVIALQSAPGIWHDLAGCMEYNETKVYAGVEAWYPSSFR